MHVPKWLDERIVLAIHDQQISEHGGSSGIMNPGLLESALIRPQNEFFYGEMPTLFRLAAAYGFGLTSNHAFFDGNKRVAFMSMYVFLRINGFILDVPEEEAVLFMLRLASGEESQASLEQWLENFSQPI